MKPEAKALLDNLAKELVVDLKPVVDKIEASTPTTKNHYGKYLNILMPLTGDSVKYYCVAKGLILAGANRQGMDAALKYLGTFTA